MLTCILGLGVTAVVQLALVKDLARDPSSCLLEGLFSSLDVEKYRQTPLNCIVRGPQIPSWPNNKYIWTSFYHFLAKSLAVVMHSNHGDCVG